MWQEIEKGFITGELQPQTCTTVADREKRRLTTLGLESLHEAPVS